MNRAGEGDSAARDGNRSKPATGKSCKGTLYYSSILKSEGRSPRCVGLSSSLPQAPSLTAGEAEAEASKEGRKFTDFKYTCVGYSLYSDDKNASNGGQKPRAQLPVCFGIELLVDKRPADGSAPAHGREDSGEFPLPRPNRPSPSRDEFLTRLTRNASVVASGVARNARRIGNHIKDCVDDVLYPYRKRPR